MIVDYKVAPMMATLFDVIDLATGRLVPLNFWYADDELAIYRSYEVDPQTGSFFLVSKATGARVTSAKDEETTIHYRFTDGTVGGRGDVQIASTEYYCSIKIRPKANLTEAEATLARQLIQDFDR